MTTEEIDAIIARRKAMKNMPLTAEEKERWAEMMHETWNAIAPDLDDPAMLPKRGYYKPSEIVELVCDANRMMMFAYMTREEDAFLSVVYHRPAFQRWARKQLNY